MNRGLWLSVALGLMTFSISAGTAFAQDDHSELSALFGGMFVLVFLLFFAAIYVYMALAMQTIAQKTKTDNAWLAWIPIVNIVLLLNIARKPLWWIILFLIPLVNLVMAIIVWMGVAEARGKESWWGILMIVPVVNLIVPGYLAWVD